jgi:hypothetical protein
MNFDVDTPEGMNRAIAWTETFLLMFKDGGIWAVPRSGTFIRIEKANKRAVKLLGLTPDPSIQKVFEAMGWTWEDET